MVLGIMQPYFFPYIGYWQLMNAVYEYIIADNVNYIKNGYINRNNILVNGSASRFGIPVRKASQNRIIAQHEHGLDEAEVTKLLDTIKSAYAKAPNYEEVSDLIKTVREFGLTDEGRRLTCLLEHAIRMTAKKLGIDTPVLLASRDIKLDGEFKRENLVVAFCKNRGADAYYNAIGGTGLYFRDFFRDNGLDLKFVKTDEDLKYRQYTDEFVPNLSIIDVMMFCSREEIGRFLNSYTLIDGFESYGSYQGSISQEK